MPYFLWTADLSTGNKFLDAEHRKLILMIDALIAVSDSGATADTVRLQLDHLIQFTQGHFEREDAEMQRIAFGGRAAHVAEHAKLLNEVKHLKSQIDAGQPISQVEIYNFLKTWLRDHVLNFDIPLVAADKLFGCGHEA